MTHFLPTLTLARHQVAKEHRAFAKASCPGGVRDMHNRLADECLAGLHDKGLMLHRVV
jgi:hypothetical protein